MFMQCNPFRIKQWFGFHYRIMWDDGFECYFICVQWAANIDAESSSMIILLLPY